MANIRLVLLGILGMQPMHGYEIKQTIEDHMGDWTDIKFGSIYFALARLAEEGAIEVVEETREGNRPSRTVYQITDKGREEYIQLLRELWWNDDRPLYSFDIGVFFMQSLPKEEVARCLDERIERMRAKLLFLKEHKSEHESNPHVPPQGMAIMNHSLAHMEAEIEWLTDMKAQLDLFY